MSDYSARPNIRYTSVYREYPRVPPRPPFARYGFPAVFPRQGEPSVYCTSGIQPRPYSDYGRYHRAPLYGNGHSRMSGHQRFPHNYHGQPRGPFEQPARQKIHSGNYGRTFKTKVYYSQQRKATSDVNHCPDEDRGKQRQAVTHFPNLVNEDTNHPAENALSSVEKIGKENVPDSNKVTQDGTGNKDEDEGSLEANKAKGDMEQTEDGKVFSKDKFGNSTEETCELITKFLRELLWGKEQMGPDEALVDGETRKNINTDIEEKNGSFDQKKMSFSADKIAEAVGSDAKVDGHIADANKNPTDNDNNVDDASDNRENMEPDCPQIVPTAYGLQRVPQIIITSPEEHICKVISEHLHELPRGQKKADLTTKAHHGKADDDEAINDSGGKTWHHGRLITAPCKVEAEIGLVFTKNLWDRIAYAMTVVDRAERQLKREDDRHCNLDWNQTDQAADYQIHEETFKIEMTANIATDSKKNELASPEIKDDPYFAAPEGGQSSSFTSSVDDEDNYFISCFRFH